MHALSQKPKYSEFLIYPSGCSRSTAGGKGYNLSQIQKFGFAVPPWFALSPEAFWSVLSDRDALRLRNCNVAGDALAVISGALEDIDSRQRFAEIVRDIHIEVDRYFATDALLAVRSSACDEDGAQHSFAGQLLSRLNVSRDGIADAVVAVWLSAFSDSNFAYRTCRKAASLVEPPAVLIQQMIQPDWSGVAFSCDPLNSDRSNSILTYVPGTAEQLVAGEVSGTTYRVYRSGFVAQPIDLEESHGAALPQSLARKVAAAARKLERRFQAPQDMEWAIQNGRLFVLQSRPITAVPGKNAASDTEDTLLLEQCTVWDNSNIGESFHGVTTPLTFSFAREAYEQVYIQFCELMGVPKRRIAEKREVFTRMLGFINGRIYYNLLSWYVLLSILPAFQTNRKFMEQMMGVKEALPESVIRKLVSPNVRFIDYWQSIGTLCNSLFSLVRLNSQISVFNRSFEKSIELVPDDMSQLSLRDLLSLYGNLERSLLPNWKAPLTNDFFAMIFYGVLRQLCLKWCGDHTGSLQNALVSNIEGVISAEPPARLQSLSRIASEDPHLLQALSEGNAEVVASAIDANHRFAIEYADYIQRFGDRCAGELKLESTTLRERPEALLRQISVLAVQLRAEPFGTAEQRKSNSREYQAALRTAQEALRTAPFQRIIFNIVVDAARERIRQRENLRFQRTRLFGAVRRIFQEIGIRFERLQLLENSRDIFFLEVPEVLAIADGMSSTGDIKSLVAIRKHEYETNIRGVEPPGRFTTVDAFTRLTNLKAVDNRPQNYCEKNGTGCSPGRVIGPVRIVRDPYAEPPLLAGEIIVAERTDPGWILVFHNAAGLLVEHGSLLSHSAIVSRELGLPAIVAIPRLTEWLKNGDIVEFDGTSGIVRKIENSDADPILAEWSSARTSRE